MDYVQGLACEVEVLKIKLWSLVRWRRMFGQRLQKERLSLWSTRLSLFLKLRRLTGLWKAVSILERYCSCPENHSTMQNTFGSFEFRPLCSASVLNKVVVYNYSEMCNLVCVLRGSYFVSLCFFHNEIWKFESRWYDLMCFPLVVSWFSWTMICHLPLSSFSLLFWRSWVWFAINICHLPCSLEIFTQAHLIPNKYFI